jgi:hypothetical protein
LTRSSQSYQLAEKSTSSWTTTALTKRMMNGLRHEGRVHFHFTPTSASWLNQIEIWFGLLTRKALRGASFASKDQLRAAIEAFVARTNENPKPFHWRKREVKGSQLRNTIINLCN